MPLLDHFHPPLYPLRHWESFHARWTASLSDALNADLLPPGYFAEIHLELSGQTDVDVPTLVEPGNDAAPPALELAAVFPDAAGRPSTSSTPRG
jgi:hypothetical protein